MEAAEYETVGRLYMAVVEERTRSAKLAELLRQTAEAQAAERPDNITEFPQAEAPNEN